MNVGFDLGAMAGSALNYFGAREANRMNKAIAEKQMDFQERMSNTSYQRAMADMTAAGLNPVLAFQQGGASSPSGSSYEYKNPFVSAVSSALQSKSITAQVEQTKVMTDILKAELAQKKVEAEIFQGSFGTVLKYLQMLSNPVSSAGSVIRDVGNLLWRRGK